MTAPVGQGVVYHDLHANNDDVQNQAVLDSYLADGTPYTLVTQGDRGELSTVQSTDGKQYYVGGFMQSEAPGPGVETGEVRFYIEKSKEGEILQKLKDAGLIPDDVQSLEELGPETIGVIENAVETGVLEVDPATNELIPGSADVSVEEAQGGAKNKVMLFEDGTRSTDSFANGDTTVYQHQDGSFHIQNGDQKPIWIDSQSFHAAGFEDGEPTAEQVSAALGDGRLNYDQRTNTLSPAVFVAIDGSPLIATDSTTFTDQSGRERTMIQTDSGYYVEGDDGKFVHVNTPAFNAVGLNVDGTNVESVAEKFEAGELALDPKGNVVAPDLTANTYDASGAMTGTVVKTDNGFWFHSADTPPEGIHVNATAFTTAGFTDPNWSTYSVSGVADRFTAGDLKNNNGVIEFVPPPAP